MGNLHKLVAWVLVFAMILSAMPKLSASAEEADTAVLNALDFGADPTGAADEDWNRTVCGGIYREEITGLGKTPIIVEGAFRLTKTLDTPNLYSGGVVP